MLLQNIENCFKIKKRENDSYVIWKYYQKYVQNESDQFYIRLRCVY